MNSAQRAARKAGEFDSPDQIWWGWPKNGLSLLNKGGGDKCDFWLSNQYEKIKRITKGGEN